MIIERSRIDYGRRVNLSVIDLKEPIVSLVNENNRTKNLKNNKGFPFLFAKCSIAIAIVCTPFQWVTVISNLTISDIGFVLSAFLGGVFILFSPIKFFKHGKTNELAVIFIISYIVTLYATLGSLIYSKNADLGLKNSIRDILYLIWIIILWVNIHRLGFVQTIRIIGFSGFFAAIFFLIVAIISLHNYNINPIIVYWDSIKNIDGTGVQYRIFGVLFNENSIQKYSSATRHTIALSFCITFIALSTKAPFGKLSIVSSKRPFNNLYIDCARCFLSFLVILTLSRQAMLILLWLWVSPVIAIKSGFKNFYKTTFFIISITTIFYLGPTGIFKEKFYYDIVHNLRVTRYLTTFDAIGDSLLLGAGAGTKIEGLYFVDQFILNSWHQAGVIPMLCSLISTISLLIITIRAYKCDPTKNFHILFSAQVAALPLIRLLVSVRGTFDMSACVSLGLLMATSHSFIYSIRSDMKK